MSRFGIIMGLVISIVLHVGLLKWPSASPPDVSDAESQPQPPLVQVAERPMEPEPEPEPAPEPEHEAPAPQPRSSPAQDSEPPPPPPPPPAPAPMERTAAASPTELEQRGDFAGEVDGEHQPALRIDWGTPEEAMHTLRQGGMQLVVLDARQRAVSIVGGVEPTASGWQLQSFAGTEETPARFSNQLRIVDQVPAFAPVADQLDLASHHRLAVMVPQRIERTLDMTQRTAARRRGLAPHDVDTFAGRFTFDAGRLVFEISHVQPRGARP